MSAGDQPDQKVMAVIRAKRAIREFTDQPVPEPIMRTILDAGRLAQSSKNTQPWQFIVVRERDTLRQLGECGMYAGHLAGAAFGVALAAPGTGNWQYFDLGQAAANMQLAAWELGVGSCIAAIWEPERAKAILGIPAEWSFEAALSFGYPLHAPSSTPRAGGRLPFDQVVRWEHW